MKRRKKYNGMEINTVLHCSNIDCDLAIDHDVNGARNIYMLLRKMTHKKRQPEALSIQDNDVV
jgi:hypothetical protein